MPASHWFRVTERKASSPSGPWVMEAGSSRLRSLAGASCQSSRVRWRARRGSARPVEHSRSLLQREDGGRRENFAGAARKGQREPQERGREYPQAHRPGPKRCEVRVGRNVRGQRGTPRVGARGQPAGCGPAGVLRPLSRAAAEHASRLSGGDAIPAP